MAMNSTLSLLNKNIINLTFQLYSRCMLWFTQKWTTDS